MAFVSWSTILDGIPEDDSKFSPEDTYVTVFSNRQYGNQDKSYQKIIELFDVIYEGPWAFNHFHGERDTPSQRIVIFEKKCPQEQNPAPNALNKVEILGATI